MKNTWLLSTACALGLLAAPAAFAQSAAMGAPSATQDATFVRQASAGGEAEIMMGQLAQQRGGSKATRDFGQMMVTDHTKANQQLMQITNTLGMKPTAQPNAMQTMVYHKLQAIPASRFDAMYARVNVKGHEMMVVAFKREIATGQNQALKTYAMQTLPTVEQHLAMAEKMAPMGGMSMMKGNADHSADMLNAKELTTASHS